MIDTYFAESYIARKRAVGYVAVLIKIEEALAVCRKMAMPVIKYFLRVADSFDMKVVFEVIF